MKYTLWLSCIAVAALGILATMNTVSAMSTPNAGATVKRVAMLQRIARELQLTPEQKTEIVQIWRSSAVQIRAIRKSASLTAEQKKEQIIGIRKATRAQIVANLTPAQRTELKRIRTKVGVKVRVGILKRIADELNLTAPQRTAIAGLIKNSMVNAKAIRNNTALSLQQKQAQLKANHAELMTQISGQLTPAQQTKLDSIMAKWRKHKA